MLDRIDKTITNLRKNGFKVHHVANIEEAEACFWESIFPVIEPRSISYGDSLTIEATGILEKIRVKDELHVVEPFLEDYDFMEKMEERRRALSVDLFITGTNALTQKGQLVNLDMWGNRIGGISFGPAHVLLFISVEKIRPDLEDAMHHVRTVVAPANASWFKRNPTSCQKTGVCVDCSSPNRICNAWSIIEKSFPKGRIEIILIDEPLGIS